MPHRFGVRSHDAFSHSSKTTGKQVVNRSRTTDATAYTVKPGDYIIEGDTPSGAQTITIPSAFVLEKGRILVVNDYGGNANVANITVATEGSETVDGSATKKITTAKASLGLYSDGANWFSF